MVRLIELSNGIISASIAPDCGGMPVSLRIGMIEVLHCDTGRLSSPMTAGGCPVMFPFPSRTAGDTYIVDGTEYGMPFHGLVKNCAFGVRSVTETSATLFIAGNPAWKQSQYPFDFELELVYELSGSSFIMIASVTNTGDKTLYHGFGWHPFFRASYKSACSLEHHCTVNYDYTNHTDTVPVPEITDLSQSWDHVLHTPSEPEFTLRNPADGYSIRCRYGTEFNALVVCTTQPAAVCVEPWCGIPNTANSHRMAQYVAPGDTRSYRTELELTEMKGCD